MERRFEIPDQTAITDQIVIAQILTERRNILEQKANIPPTEVLKFVDFNKSYLTRQERKLIGVLVCEFGNGASFTNPLYDIPDIKVDLSPEEVDLPRQIMSFILNAESKSIMIDVLYNPIAQPYWEHYGDIAEVEELIQAKLLETLPAKSWQCDWTGAWYVDEDAL